MLNIELSKSHLLSSSHAFDRTDFMFEYVGTDEANFYRVIIMSSLFRTRDHSATTKKQKQASTRTTTTTTTKMIVMSSRSWRRPRRPSAPCLNQNASPSPASPYCWVATVFLLPVMNSILLIAFCMLRINQQQKQKQQQKQQQKQHQQLSKNSLLHSSDNSQPFLIIFFQTEKE